MIIDIQKDLSEMEKAYYIYLEIGKIVKESPKFVFANKTGKVEQYYDLIDDTYYGICKSISELYVSILKDERIGIPADLVRRYPEALGSHIDTILKIDGKIIL